MKRIEEEGMATIIYKSSPVMEICGVTAAWSQKSSSGFTSTVG